MENREILQSDKRRSGLYRERPLMITHIERPILAMQLSKIFASNTIDKMDQDIVHSILQEINNNKSVLDFEHDDRNALIGILNKHMNVAYLN